MSFNQYIFLNHQPVAKLEQKQLYAIHSDHLGTPRLASNDDKETVWKANYSPFGKAEIKSEKISLNLRLPGQYEDQETGTHYNYLRDYNPETGRYITSDPIGLKGGVNTYAYVGGDPLSSIDPYGLYRLVIGIELPPPGSVDANDVLNIEQGANTGHTFLYAVDNNGIITHSLSFGPKNLTVKRFLTGTNPGTADWNFIGNAEMYEFDISESQYKSGTLGIELFRANVPNYTPLTHCTTSAIDLTESWLAGFNINLPDGSGSVRIDSTSDPLPFNWTNPYHLNQALIAEGHTPRTINTSMLVDASNILKLNVRDPLLGANIPPSGSADSGDTSSGKTTSINVLNNDTDPDGGDLSIASFDNTSANGGSISRGKANGVLVYNPPDGFTGTDTFSYVVKDGSGGSQTVTVTVTVN